MASDTSSEEDEVEEVDCCHGDGEADEMMATFNDEEKVRRGLPVQSESRESYYCAVFLHSNDLIMIGWLTRPLYV